MFIRLFFILFVYLFWGTAVFSQSKPVLDMAALEGWTGVGKDEDVRISADGKYFSYSIVQGDWPMRRLRT
ncbi:MAG: hypothetical protein J7497_01295, partial [Chitinophagaceae bacterium]|nr:hypothetical protein [Chitinophagaceae bacterium]